MIASLTPSAIRFPRQRTPLGSRVNNGAGLCDSDCKDDDADDAGHGDDDDDGNDDDDDGDDGEEDDEEDDDDSKADDYDGGMNLFSCST